MQEEQKKKKKEETEEKGAKFVGRVKGNLVKGGRLNNYFLKIKKKTISLDLFNSISRLGRHRSKHKGLAL